MKRLIQGALATGLLLAHTAYGAIEPQAMDLGGFQFIPTLGLSQSHDDNIFSQATNEKESWITRVSPQLQLAAQKNASMYALTYSGDYGTYSSSSADDYDDHTFSFDALIDTTTRNRFTIGASYGMLHDNRGEGSSEGIIASSRSEPDEYDVVRLGGKWDFGAPGAMLGFSLGVDTTDVEYQNNRVETQFRDRDDLAITARVKGSVTGKTTLFMEIGKKDIEYDTLPLFGPTLNSEETGIYLGAEWDITGATTGSAKLGRVEKDFEAVSRGEENLTVWELGVSWAPRTYSVFDLTSSRMPQETNGTGAYIRASNTTLAWTHGWNERLNSSVSYTAGKDTYPGNTRVDDRESWSAGVSLDVYRWMNVGASYTFNDRGSNSSQFDFEKNVLMFSLNVSL